MTLDPEAAYRVIQTKDGRFDGRLFVGVCTTGIFCRPICPAATPKRENCAFYSSAAAACEAGFRPCLRCRPELSPHLWPLIETSTTIRHALRLIGEGFLDEGSVAKLAQKLGVGDRHLRHLFSTHLGTSPLAVAQTRRLLFAKQLLSETSLTMTEIAMAAGFGSIRRFNDVFGKTYGRAPTTLRRLATAPTTASSEVTLKLPFCAPYDWGSWARFMAARATPGLEVVAPDGYQRTIALDGIQGAIEVRPVADQTHLLARIHFPRVTALATIVEQLRELFDLRANVAEIAAHLQQDPRLARVVGALPRLRVPGAWDPFEVAVRAILGQQVSVAAATTLASRLVATFGQPLTAEVASWIRPELCYVFPRPEALALADLTRLGLPRARAEAINALAATLTRDPGFLRHCSSLEESIERLCQLPGIGRWTAQYIAMRALREPDAFPEKDAGLVRAMRALGYPSTEVNHAIARWRPWRAYAAIYLWNLDPLPVKKTVEKTTVEKASAICQASHQEFHQELSA